jgi:hypothetical protein
VYADDDDYTAPIDYDDSAEWDEYHRRTDPDYNGRTHYYGDGCDHDHGRPDHVAAQFIDDCRPFLVDVTLHNGDTLHVESHIELHDDAASGRRVP